MTNCDEVLGWRTDEVREMKFLGQDIQLFLRMAQQRVLRENVAGQLPFTSANGVKVIQWLMKLSEQYGNGQDIT